MCNKSLFFLVLCLLLSSTVSAATCHDTALPGDNIQQKLNDLADYKHLCLSEGFYSVNESISLRKGQRLLGIKQNGQQANRSDVVINSSEENRIVLLAEDSRVAHLSIESSGNLARAAIHGNGAPNARVWDVGISKVERGITFINSNGVQIKTTFITDTGGIGDCDPDPSIWFRNSDNVVLWYNTIKNRADGQPVRICDPSRTEGFLDGDGEIACHDSTGLQVTGGKLKKTGAAGFYLVNCDNVNITNVKINDAGGWAIDSPRYSDNLVIESVTISNSGRAAILLGTDNQTPSVSNSVFNNNNIDGIAACQGIYSRIENTVSVSGNIATPADGTNSPTFDKCTY